VSQAASQASIFFEQVARERRAFTLLDEGHYIAMPMSNGDVVPFWSSRSRVEKVQGTHPKYASFEIDETPLDTFLTEVLPRFDAHATRVGANWSGPRLTGFDYSVPDVRKNLEYWIQELNAPR
jgi:hypothetical protein